MREKVSHISKEELLNRALKGDFDAKNNPSERKVLRDAAIAADPEAARKIDAEYNRMIKAQADAIKEGKYVPPESVIVQWNKNSSEGERFLPQFQSGPETSIDQMGEHLAHLESKVDAIVDVTHDLCKTQEQMNEQNRHTYYYLQLMEAGFLNLQNELERKAKNLQIELETIRIAAGLLPEHISAIRKDVTERFNRENDIAREKFLEKQRFEAEQREAAKSATNVTPLKPKD